MPKIMAITEAMHSYAKNILARAGEIQSSHGEMERIANEMRPNFRGPLPELLTQKLLDMKKKHEAMYEAISDYSEKIDYAADTNEWTDIELARWIAAMGASKTTSGTTPDGVSSSWGNSRYGIPGGEFRYVNQLYNLNGEWGEYDMYTQPGSLATGCNVACFTMALSSLGIDVTPEDVCNKNKAILESHKMPVGTDRDDFHPTNISRDYGNELASLYGAKYEYNGSIDAYLKQYTENPGKFSAPVVRIPGSGQDGTHFVIVTGQNRDGTYSVVDPYNQTRETINASAIGYAYQLSK